MSTERIAEPGQALIPLKIPDIKTLIYQTGRKSEEILKINIEKTVKKSNLPNKVAKEKIGIQLDSILLTTPEPSYSESNIANVGTLTETSLPTTPEEVWNKLYLISPKKTGKNVKVYSLKNLQGIARNIGLQSRGKKADVANRIIKYIKGIYQPYE